MKTIEVVAAIIRKGDRYWYADIPSRTKEENEMVCGADKLLDLIYKSSGQDNNALEFMLADSITNHDLILTRRKRSYDGYEYIISGMVADRLRITGERCWLCGVIKDVFRRRTWVR